MRLTPWERSKGPERWYKPTTWKRSTYNSVLVIAGATLLTDSLPHAMGLILVAEAFLVTIEGCWNKDADQ